MLNQRDIKVYLISMLGHLVLGVGAIKINLTNNELLWSTRPILTPSLIYTYTYPVVSAESFNKVLAYLLIKKVTNKVNMSSKKPLNEISY